MSPRLEKALKELSSDEVEVVADFAEALATKRKPTADPQYLKMDWVGSLKDAAPEASGVDAAHTASEMRRQIIR